MMARSAFRLAQAQLDGGVPWGRSSHWRCSLFVCQRCGGEYHLRDGNDPCAFCDDCKNDVLDILAVRLISLLPKKRKTKGHR